MRKGGRRAETPRGFATNVGTKVMWRSEERKIERRIEDESKEERVEKERI